MHFIKRLAFQSPILTGIILMLMALSIWILKTPLAAEEFSVPSL